MRVSYDKQTREKAKAEGKGLITVEIVMPSGSRSTTQFVAGGRMRRYAHHAVVHLLKLSRADR